MPRNELREETKVVVGTMVPFTSGTVPIGYMECDGTAIDRSLYPALFDTIGETWGVGDGSTTFNLPDTRGQFLRGLDESGTIDPDGVGKVVGDSQLDAFEDHKHLSVTRVTSDVNGEGTENGLGIAGAALNTGPLNYSYRTGGDETRPKNVAVKYIIKVG